MQCPFCRKSISFSATVCPYCTRDVPSSAKSQQVVLWIAAGLVVAVFNAFWSCQGTSPRDTRAVIQRPSATTSVVEAPGPVPMPSYADAGGAFRCPAEKVVTARDILSMVTHAANGLADPLVARVSETKNGGVSYTFHPASWDVVANNLSGLVTSIANADACVEGRARRIDFYDPRGAHVAFADPRQGVTMAH
jgi:hypothetical protein